ncbi:MAG: efflux RND transporter periplasmic adaptor subunit [Clostridiales Family XIII bacterium]|nr:efflux RND transporter periplasmic adaptor subunit [Clostridiales Family XIII bacterium]
MRVLKQELAIGLTLVLLLTGCAAEQSAAANSLKVKTVTVITTAAEPCTDSLDYKGFVSAKETKTVAFVQPGTVENIYVEESRHVKAGDLLAALDTDGINMAVEAARINEKTIRNSYDAGLATLELTLKQTRDSCDRATDLYEAGAVSRVDYQAAVDGLEAVKTELRKTEEAYANDLAQIEISLKQYALQLANSVLTAPIDGIVTNVIAQKNQIAGAGAPAIVLVSEEKIVRIGVPIDDISRLAVGMDTDIKLSGGSLAGKVSKIAQYPDQNSRTYAVEVTPEAGDLNLGEIADVKIPLEIKNEVLIPLSAVLTNEGVNFVYIVEANENGEYRVMRQEVLLGAPEGSTVAALNLEPGKMIAADGVKNIKENDIVAVRHEGM